MMIRSGIDPLPTRSAFSWAPQLTNALSAFLRGTGRLHPLYRPRWFAPAKDVTLELSEVLDCFAEGYLIVDAKLKILFANRVICEILSIPRDRLERRSIDSLKWCSCASDHRPWHGTGATERAAEASSSAVNDEQLMAFERHDRSRRLLAITVREMTGAELAGTKVISLRDATDIETYRAEMENMLARIRRSREEMKASNEQLKQLVAQDALTGCRNRRSLDEQSLVAWEVSQATDKDLACLMFDIDHFKSVNDQHGHAAGDEVLRRFGQSLRDTFAGVGHVYRYGGEEFCVLLPKHNLSEAQWIAERVRVSTSQIEVHSPGTPSELIPITVSIGVTDRRAGATDPAGMIDQADKCLYLAKRQGRNRVVAYGADVASARFRTGDR